MTRHGPYSVSGFGHQVINDSAQVQDITVVITAYGNNVSRTVQGPPHSVRGVGEVGIACFSDDSYGCDPPSVFWSQGITWDVQVLLAPTTVEALAVPSVFWRLNPGVTIDLYVDT